jgi:hypothetical protein
MTERERDDYIMCYQNGYYCHSMCVDRLRLGFNSESAGGSHNYDGALKG